jgi:hypothetical protein
MWIRELATGWERVYKPSEHASASVTRGTRDAVPTDIFGIVGIQTNDIIILVDKRFSPREKEELKQAKYTAKPKKKLTAINLLLFNSYILLLQGDQMTFCQKD